MTPRPIRALAAIAVLGVSTWALAVPAARVLPTPPLTSLHSWWPWLTGTGPTVAAASVMRVVTLVGTGLETAVLAMVAAGSAVRTVRLLEPVVPGPLMALAVLLLGTAVAGCSRGVAGSATPAGAWRGAPPATVTISAPAPGAGLRQPRWPAAPGAPSRPAAPPAPAASAASPAPAQWTVRPGDSFWAVAVDVVRQSGGDPADTGAVAAYWVRLMRANPRPDPDVLYPGQVLVVPPLGHKGE